MTKVVSATLMIIRIYILMYATPHVVNKGSWNARGGTLRIVGIIGIKWNWWFVHKNITRAMQKGSQMLVNLIGWIHEVWLILKDKCIKH
jgi:divalent metal cation (Fe/Co/Zn/Cd) transporter